jgi:Phage gp6-like head-tail connector protein
VTDVRDVGDGYPIRYEARNTDTGALTDATVALTLTSAAGVTTPSPTHTGTGLYDYTIPLSTSGPWYWRWDVSGTVVDIAYGSVLAASPAPATYASLAQLKSWLKITDTNDDAKLTSALVAATRRINLDCGRSFWPQTAPAAPRIYRARHPELLQVDDFPTMTDLVVEVGRGSTWTAIDVANLDALPENAEADLHAIETLVRTAGVWPVFGNARVRVTPQRWGWLACPEDIVTACIILGARLGRRSDSPEGIVGNSEFGPIRVSRYDADYDTLISGYVRMKP